MARAAVREVAVGRVRGTARGREAPCHTRSNSATDGQSRRRLPTRGPASWRLQSSAPHSHSFRRCHQIGCANREYRRMRAAARAVRPCHTRSSAAQRFRTPVPPPTHALARMRHHSNGRLRQSLRNVHRMGSSSVAYRHTTRGRARERRRRMMTMGRLGQRRACWHGGKLECGGGGRCPSDRRLWVRRGGSRVPRRADGTDGYVCQPVCGFSFPHERNQRKVSKGKAFPHTRDGACGWIYRTTRVR